MLVRGLFFLAIGYAIFLFLLYALQRRMMYFPCSKRLALPESVGLSGMMSVVVHTQDNLDLIAWFSPPAEKGGKVVVIFHGNAGDISDRANRAAAFMAKGYGVFMCEYRGYGGNPGMPTEQGLYEDARAGLRWLQEQGCTRRQFVLYGESLGTGVAVQMALETAASYLILEAPFSSTSDVAKARYPFVPVDMLMHDTFDSIAKISKLKTSLLIIHGTADETIDIRFGKKLYAAARDPKEFVEVSGAAHTNLYDFKAAELVTDWLSRQPEA